MNAGTSSDAASLCKTDLTTELVKGSLPELQGIVGGLFTHVTRDMSEVQ